MALTHTHTKVRYFDPEMVDELVGTAHKKLAEDFELRRAALDRRTEIAMNARLELLRHTWLLLLDEVP
jgi:hypothetical protein